MSWHLDQNFILFLLPLKNNLNNNCLFPEADLFTSSNISFIPLIISLLTYIAAQELKLKKINTSFSTPGL